MEHFNRIVSLTVTTPEGMVQEFTPDGWSVSFTSQPDGSEATAEGVEGEPKATLGGQQGSPRTGMWCRFCGSLQNPHSDMCAGCWASGLEVTGKLIAEFGESLAETAAAFSDYFVPSSP